MFANFNATTKNKLLNHIIEERDWENCCLHKLLLLWMLAILSWSCLLHCCCILFCCCFVWPAYEKKKTKTNDCNIKSFMSVIDVQWFFALAWDTPRGENEGWEWLASVQIQWHSFGNSRKVHWLSYLVCTYFLLQLEDKYLWLDMDKLFVSYEKCSFFGKANICLSPRQLKAKKYTYVIIGYKKNSK